MNIGSLYRVKKDFWFLFPTREIAAAAAARSALARSAAAYWSKHSNCEVTYFSPDSIVVFLENDGKFKRVLTGDGRIGWIWFNKDYISCFEEVSNE